MEPTIHKDPWALMYRFGGWATQCFAGVWLFALLDDLISGRGLAGDHFWYVGAIIFLEMFSILHLIYSPRIHLCPDGLHVQHLVFFWLWVPWKNVICIIEQEDVSARLDGVLVKARESTVFHRLITLKYGAGSEPSFNIASRVNDYESLLATIRQKSPLLSEF